MNRISNKLPLRKSYIGIVGALLVCTSGLKAVDIWIPPDVDVLQGLYLTCGTTSSMDFTEACKVWKFGYINENIGIPEGDKGQIQSPVPGTKEAIEAELKRLADETGHPEIEHLPFVAGGESRTAAYAYHLATIFPERAIAIAGVGLSIGGPDVPKSVPRVFTIADGDNAHGTHQEKSEGWFLPSRAEKALISAAVQRGYGHGYYNANDFVWCFFDQIIKYRLPHDADARNGVVTLRNYREKDGWLGDFFDWNSTYPYIASYSEYKGDKKTACWFPNRYVAQIWRAFCSKTPSGDLSINAPGVPWSRAKNGFGYRGNRWVSLGDETVFQAYSEIPGERTTSFWYGDQKVDETVSNESIIKGSGPILSPGVHGVYAEIFKNGVGYVSQPGLIGVMGGNDNIYLSATCSDTEWTEGSTITLTATPFPGAGAFTKVDFVANDQTIHTDSEAPFSYTWENVPADAYIFRAAGYNGDQVSIESSEISRFVIGERVISEVSLQPSTVWLSPTEGATLGKITSIQPLLGVYDQYGDPIVTDVEWSSDNDAALTIAENGTISSGTESGTYKVFARAGELSDSITVQVYDVLRVNFQPKNEPTPPGFIVDEGRTYRAQNGYTYGWDDPNDDNARKRLRGTVYDDMYPFGTVNHVVRTDGVWEWEMELPNGDYLIHAVAGDIGYPGTHKLLFEGETIVNGTSPEGFDFVEGTGTATVSDGKLTLSSNYVWSKVAFIEIAHASDTEVPFTPLSVKAAQRPATRTDKVRTSALSYRNGKLTVNVGHGTGYRIRITDLRGRTVLTREIHRAGTVSLALPPARGAYLVELLQNGGLVAKHPITLIGN